MRKYLIIAVAAIVSSLAVTSIAQADDIQSITAKLTPTKLDKKKFKPAKIYVEILTVRTRAIRPKPDQPPSASNTKVNFPANMKFDTKAVPKCKGDRGAAAATRRPTQAKQSAATSRSSASRARRPDRPERTTHGYLGLGHGRSARRRHQPRPGCRDGVQRQQEEHDVPALPTRRSVNNTIGPGRQAQERPEGLRRAARRDDPAAPRRRDQPLHDDREGRQVRPGPLQDEDREVAGDHELQRTTRQTTDDYTSTCKQKKKKQVAAWGMGAKRAAEWPPVLRSGTESPDGEQGFGDSWQTCRSIVPESR